MKLNDIYKKIDSLNKEVVNEVASMNISMSGETADDVGKLLKMMRDAGLEKAEPVGPDMLSPGDMRGDIDKFSDIVNKGQPDMGPPSPMDIPCGAPDGPDDGPKIDIIGLGGDDDKHDHDGMSHSHPDGDKDHDHDDEKESDYANEPDEKYGTTDLMTKDLAGGLNGPKKSYPKVAGGDNPMSIRAELTRLENTIKDELWKALEEKKKPDFLDMDKDGDKKEPMKKAIKDKGKK